ncbi:hypothetical protein [Ottowia thiooxydans]|uniref:hypothetical protein n=1 Tax=Ottowia thiooxydans TaxID=219182 RepID=UPI000422F3FA|nr:hypothetical protein [Ottowia thiooxydans]
MGRDKRPAKTYADKFVGVNLSLLNSPAYIALDRSSQALFFDLRVKLNGFNNGNINAALSELRHRGWTAPVTLAKALRQLEAAGFIAKTRATIGVENGSKVCNLYRFTDLEVFENLKLHIDAMKPTHEYLAAKTLTEARRVIKAATAPRARATKNKTTLQKMQRADTETVSMGAFDATVSVLAPPATH